VLADCCEAVIAALYLDGGLEAARAFVTRHWQPLLAVNRLPPRDPKTALQEWAQARGRPLPDYREVDRSGPDHAPSFVVEVSVEGLPPARAEGVDRAIAAERHGDPRCGILGKELAYPLLYLIRHGVRAAAGLASACLAAAHLAAARLPAVDRRCRSADAWQQECACAE